MTITTPVQADRLAPTEWAGAKKKRAEAAWNGVPPLERGDHLSRVEFERRYAAMPYVKKAELIEGVVHLPSPVHYLAALMTVLDQGLASQEHADFVTSLLTPALTN